MLHRSDLLQRALDSCVAEQEINIFPPDFTTSLTEMSTQGNKFLHTSGEDKYIYFKLMMEHAHKCVDVFKDLKINLKEKEEEGKKIQRLSEFVKKSTNKEVSVAFDSFKSRLYMLTRIEDLCTVIKYKDTCDLIHLKIEMPLLEEKCTVK